MVVIQAQEGSQSHLGVLHTCRGLKLDFILNTHHHWDHTGGNTELKRHYNCQIVGPKADKDRIPGIDIALGDGDTWHFGNLEMRVFDTPGHTRGHITLWFPEAEALFPGRQPVENAQCFMLPLFSSCTAIHACCAVLTSITQY